MKSKDKQVYIWLKKISTKSKLWIHSVIIFSILDTCNVIFQAYILSLILQHAIVDKADVIDNWHLIVILFFTFVIKSLFYFLKQQFGYYAGENIRQYLRYELLKKINQQGAKYVQKKSQGEWGILLVEQIEKVQEYYAKYLPQTVVVGLSPLIIFLAIVPVNWFAACILILCYPLLFLFMMLIGYKTVEKNTVNFSALQYLSNFFLDRMLGLQTIRIFNQEKVQIKKIHQASENFRKKTMEVLHVVFLSSAVLEFFISLSIALIAVYLGFYYLKVYDFGHYGYDMSLYTGLFILLLAPEFFQSIRELNQFYHYRAEAIAATRDIYNELHEPVKISSKNIQIKIKDEFTIKAINLMPFSFNNKPLLKSPVSFEINRFDTIGIQGRPGVGKTSILQVILGFLPYKGSITVNNIEINHVNKTCWRNYLTLLEQNAVLFNTSIYHNLNCYYQDKTEILSMLKKTQAFDFIEELDGGLDYQVGEKGQNLSVGQSQLLCLSRTLLKPSALVILDEPIAFLNQEYREVMLTALEKLLPHYTNIIVSHDPKVFKLCTNVIHIDE